MATMKAPIAQMREKFTDKESLVDRLLSVIELGSASKDDTKTRLLAVSNKKLLRLFEVASEIKSKHGGNDGLAEATAKANGKAKDAAYIDKLKKLAQKSPARVLDLFRAAGKRTKAAGAIKGAAKSAAAKKTAKAPVKVVAKKKAPLKVAAKKTLNRAKNPKRK